MTTRKLILALAAPCVLCAPLQLSASGFQVLERSARGLGRAFSGEAAIADDASIISSNPTGMIMLDGTSISTGLTYADPVVNLNGSNPLGQQADAKDVIEEALIPYFYLSHKVDNQLALGLALYTTHGLKNSYSDDFSAKISPQSTELETITIEPALAYRINQQWSLGIGISAVYAEAKLRGRSVPPFPVPDVESTGSDWSWGYHLGVLYECSENTRFGLYYKSNVNLNLKGDNVVNGNQRAGSLEVDLPETIEFSAYHQLNDNWAIHGDVVWTHWSRFEELNFNDPEIPVTTENWDNSMRYAIGATYFYNDSWTFRAGISYEESPVPDAQHRTVRIPDADRYWLAVGASYQLNECYALDFGYSYITSATADIEETEIPNGLFDGESDASVHLVSVGISGSF